MVNKKDRRHRGRKDILMGEHLFTYWDDWNDWRDGIRFPFDNTKLRSIYCWYSDDVQKYNIKIKRLLQRRKAMKRK